jgi:hypothetical protein
MASSARVHNRLKRALDVLRAVVDQLSSIAVRRDHEFVRRFNRLRELGIYESHVCEIADDVYAILPAMIRESGPCQ